MRFLGLAQRWLVALPVLVLSMLVLMGCGTVHPTLAELRAVPGATVRYPGSTQIRSFDQESSGNLFAKNQAVLKSDWCTSAPDDAYRDWFAHELRALGWSERHTGVSTADPDVTLFQEWTRGGRTFDLYRLSSSYVARAGLTCAHAYRITVT